MRRRSLRVALASAAVSVAALGAAASADAFVYWANYGIPGDGGGSTIGRANLDGTGQQSGFIGGADSPCGLAVNSTHIFWANNDIVSSGDPGTTVGRANIDGSGVIQDFVTGSNGPCQPAVDSNFLYWANWGSNTIGRIGLDGTGLDQNFVTGVGTACGVAVTPEDIFWPNDGGNAIGRSLITGASPNPTFIPVTPAPSDPCGIATNSAHVYWAASANNVIGRANLDGSGVDQNFITGAAQPCGLAVDDTHIYWANLSDQTIGRAELDGSNVDQDFLTVASDRPCGVAVDDNVRTTEASVSCAPTGAALNQPTTCTARIADTFDGPPTAPTGSVSFSSASGGADFPGSSTCNLVAQTPDQSSCGVTYRPGFGANLVLGFYAGDTAHDGAQDVGQVSVSNYGLGAVTFNRKAGTATLIANAPGPGVVTQNGDRTAAQTAQAAAAGPVALLIRATGSALRKLKRTGSVTVIAETDFTPSGGGQEGSANQPVRLVKSKKKKKKKK